MNFEGIEKKLEIRLSADKSQLRNRPRAFWNKVVRRAGAEILGHISNEFVDSYVLSESSLFVYDDRLIMITCGSTALVRAAEDIVQTVGAENITYFRYERKKEYFPECQPSTFQEDVRFLKRFISGETRSFGRPGQESMLLFHMNRADTVASVGSTMELLMHGLNGRACEVFRGRVCHRQEVVDLGLLSVLEGFEVHDYFFEPNGYSVNAIRGRNYYTIHITPEEVGAYVSFETNLNLVGRLQPVVERLLSIIQPERAELILFQNEPSGHGRLLDPAMNFLIREELSGGEHIVFKQYLCRDECAPHVQQRMG